MTMFTKFDHNPTTAHLVSDSSSGARAGERIEDQVTRIRRDSQNTIDEALRFWCVEWIVFTKESLDFFF